MTIEEIDIIVTAKVEEALKEFTKIAPVINKQLEEAKKAFSKVDTKAMTSKVHQAVQLVKKKMQDLKKSNTSNEIAIKINNKDASKQINQIQREIDSLQKKISERQMKLDIITPKLDSIANEPMNKAMPDRLEKNKQYINLSNKEEVIVKEIQYYNKQLEEAKSKMSQLKQATNQTATTQNQLSSYFNVFKGKIEQAKMSTKNLKNTFSQMPKITQNITNNIKNIASKMKQGVGQVLKYATALFGLRTIYSALRSSAQSWLSSQNSQAQQLSANIEYMKYSMGSVFAPVIEYITNLVYQLMKAVQSLVYAFSGVNIFAKATASSMNKTAGSAKQASKSLAGVHNEINNVSEKDNSSSGSSIAPSMDLSQLDNTPNKIIDVIKNGDWYKVGETIGQKLNEAMENIPWDKIQNTAKKIGKNTAELLNGSIAKTDWKQLGNTLAQGINTLIYAGYEFVTTFDWQNFGNSIGQSVNSFFEKIDWATMGQTFGGRIIGILTSIKEFLKEVDWEQIGEDIKTFLVNIDWNKIFSELAIVIGEAIGGMVQVIIGMLGDYWSEQWEKFKQYGEEAGGNILVGIARGFLENMGTGWKWAYDNLAKPLIDGFCNALGIHSPSTVFAEFGGNIIQGLVNGIESLIGKITEIWDNIKQTASNVFNNIKDIIVNIWSNITNTTSNVWNTIKDKVKEGAQGAWNAITSIFGNISGWFKDKFSQAWQAVKNVFSTGGAIFDGIKDGILNGLKSIINAIISGINKVIRIPFNGINSALRAIRNVNIMGLQPFSWISTISVPQIPRLAKGNVAYSETMAIFGEYAGASSNPEITTPQNVMRETFDEVLSNHEWNNNSNDSSIQLSVYVGNKRLGQILLDDLKDIKRRTGKDIEALVN